MFYGFLFCLGITLMLLSCCLSSMIPTYRYDFTLKDKAVYSASVIGMSVLGATLVSLPFI